MDALNRPYLVSIGSQDLLVAHIENGQVYFMEERLKEIMKNYGIQIPSSEIKNFEGKSVIYLKEDGNQLFEKAFRSIYYHLHMPKDEYQWRHEQP